MRDPYLYSDVAVLRNKLGIKSQSELDNAEADCVVFRLKELVSKPLAGGYDSKHLFAMHEYIFQDLYDWAGMPRTVQIYKEEVILGNQSVEYTEPSNIVAEVDCVLCEMRAKDWESFDIKKLSEEFCASMARLWKIHPFREGNTRTTVTFCCQFADENGFPPNRQLFEKNSAYLRTALVAYNAYFTDGNNFSKSEYLERIVLDALTRKP